MIKAAPFVRVLAVASLLGGAAFAQCSPAWAAGDGLPGVDGEVHAVVEWDPDGAGPRAPGLLVGGAFDVAGSVAASNIAFCDRSTGVWSELGLGTDGPVYALAVLATGDVVVGGSFANAGVAAATNVARWDGQQWSSLSGGVGTSAQPCRSLLAHSNGELIASGNFGVRRWDGIAWSVLSSSIGATALTEHANGDVIAAAGQAVQRWDGTSWQALGFGNDQVRAVLSLPNGDLLASGRFASLAGVAAAGVARWDGVQWHAIGAGVGSTGSYDVRTLALLANGDLVAGGQFGLAGGAAANNVARWDGAAWHPFGDGVSDLVRAVAALPSGELVVAGRLWRAGNLVPLGLACWDGSFWTHVVDYPVPSPVFAIEALPNGGFVVGGGDASLGNIARFTSGSWQQLGSGTNDNVRALCRLPNGDLVAGGNFTVAGGLPANGVARWDGSSWSPLGAGLGQVSALAVLPGGDLVAAGGFPGAVARWDGSAWSLLGGGFPAPAQVYSLLVRGNGDLVAGGAFAAGAIRGIARWDGSSWTSLGAVVNGSTSGAITALHELPGGVLVAGGNFQSIGGVPCSSIASWDGSVWSPLGSGSETVAAMTTLPGGDLLVSSYESTADRLRRWDGASWTQVPGSDQAPFALARLANGDVMVGGPGILVGTGANNSAFLQRLTSPCPAATASSSVTCSGSSGAHVLVADGLPWTGTTFRSQASGLPVVSLAFSVAGFATQAIPLAAVLPQGVAGCALLATTDAVEARLPVDGQLANALAIPHSPSLAGLQVHQQVVAAELDASGAILALTATNRLTLTIGSF